jgi:hypothetical protein
MNKVNEKFQINNVVKIIKYPEKPHWFDENYQLGSLYIITDQKKRYSGNRDLYTIGEIGGNPIGGMAEDCMEFCYDICFENNNKELIIEIW